MEKNKIHAYVEEKKELYDIIFTFLDTPYIDENDFQNLINFINTHNYFNNQENFRNILCLIAKISNNHHRKGCFIPKIEKILLSFKDHILQTLSNFTIFQIFRNNNLILLFLLENGILTIDKEVFDEMINCELQFCHFFAPEIQKYIEKEKITGIDLHFLREYAQNESEFNEKRHRGENDSYIATLIRQDSIKEFVFFMNKLNFSYEMLIDHSIFETNSLLIERKVTLIEYAAFHGSLKIFNFIRDRKIPLNPSLWLFAIHSNNAKLIHILEDNKVIPPENTFKKCLYEAIKCHHNQIANYFQMCYTSFDDVELKEDIYINSLNYHNYMYLPYELDDKYGFYYLCCFGYTNLINFLLDEKKPEIEKLEIHNKIIFL